MDALIPFQINLSENTRSVFKYVTFKMQHVSLKDCQDHFPFFFRSHFWYKALAFFDSAEKLPGGKPQCLLKAQGELRGGTFEMTK